jgi:hypothetical protein
MKKIISYLIACACTLVFMTSTSMGQSKNCYTYSSTTGTMVWNGSCNNTSPSPWQISAGKIFSVSNTLSLAGIDNQVLDLSGLPQGNLKLGTAALASASSFQPVTGGAVINLVGVDAATSVANGTGTKTWTAVTPVSLGFATGMIVTAIETANPQVYMQGSVTSYSGQTLVINSTYSQGSFTGAGWTIQISGPQGPQGSAGAGGAPVGSMEIWASASLPSNYLWCSGASYTACVSKTTYSGLYAAIGDTWTTGNSCSAGTFGLPDMRGRLPIGAGQGSTAEGGGTGTNRVLGATGGAETHTQATGEVGAHTHSVYDPGHVHQIPYPAGIGGGTPYGGGPSIPGYMNDSLAYTGISIYANATPSPMTVMNPFDVVQYIIRYN